MIRVIVIIISAFLLNLKCLKGDMLYLLDDRKVSWSTATSSCKLATPRTNFIGGELIAEVGNAHLDMKEGEEAWLGYSVEPVILQSVGCTEFNINQEPNLARYINTGADPGRCFSACGEQGYIGLMDDKCFCLKTLSTDKIYETECTKTCSGMKNQTACGGTKFVSIYKQAENISASMVFDFVNEMLNGKCVVFDKTVGRYYSKLCSLSLRIGCQDSSGVSVNIGSRTVTWLQMTQFCFSQKLLTYTDKGALADNGTYSAMWTGMVKAGKLVKNRLWQDDRLSYAFIKYQNGNFNMHFTTGLPSEQKKFLCQIGETTTSTETTAAPPVTDSTETSEEPEPEGKVTSEPEPEPVAEGSVSSLLPLYIILPLVFIALTIVVIFFVIRWRRKKRNDQLKTNRILKSSNGNAEENKGRKSLTEKSHLSHENVAMYDIMKEETNDAIKNDKRINDRKLVLNPNFSNNLHATLPLDNVPTTSNDVTRAGPSINDAGKTRKSDNEYARINKGRKVTTPKIPEEEQSYDKVNDRKQVNNDLNYDKVKQDATGDDMYDTTVKPKNVSNTDGLYDGLSKF